MGDKRRTVTPHIEGRSVSAATYKRHGCRCDGCYNGMRNLRRNRRTRPCANCGETKLIVSRGLCNLCYCTCRRDGTIENFPAQAPAAKAKYVNADGVRIEQAIARHGYNITRIVQDTGATPARVAEVLRAMDELVAA